MTKIIVMVGISGSGKSTRAKELKDDNSIIVSRDKLREMLFGYTEETMKDYYKLPDVYKYESQVNKFQDTIVKEALKKDLTVILDSTHLKLKYINEIKKKYNYQIDFELVECSVENAIVRDALRTRTVGREVIKKQELDLKQLKSTFDFATVYPKIQQKIVQDDTLPEAIIFDIDGTLAKMNGRSPYDYSKVNTDVKNQTVVDVCASLGDDYAIIVCTGRDAVCERETKMWLAENGIWHSEFHIRPEGDVRKDYIVKEEMWRNISTRYNIIGMVDDRNQVVDHARSLGFTVFQVDYGDF